MNTEAIEDLDTMDCAETRNVSDPSDDRSPWDRGGPPSGVPPSHQRASCGCGSTA